MGGLSFMTAKEFQAKFGRIEEGIPAGTVGPKAQIRIPKSVTPNKTEAAWMEQAKRRHPNAEVKYEPLTFRLPSGTRYTPDVIVFAKEGGQVLAVYEVKGPHIHNSASIRAFKEARSAFPWWPFKFAQLTKDGWAIA